MISSIQKIYSVLLVEHRRGAVFLLILIFVGMGVEAVSVGMIIPALSLFSGEAAEQSNGLSRTVISYVKSIGGDNYMLLMASLLAAIFFLRSILVLVISWVRLRFITEIRVSTSQRLFLAYMAQDYGFHIRQNTSGLVRNVLTEATKFASLLNVSFVFLSDALVVLVLLALVLLIFPAESFSVLLLFSAAWLLFYYTIGKRMPGWGERRQLSDGQRLQHVQQGLNAYKDVRLLGKEAEFVEFYRPFNETSARMAQYNSFAKGVPRILFETALVLAMIGVVIIQSYAERSFVNLIPKLGLFAIAAFRVLPSVNRLASGYNGIKFGRAVADIVYQHLKLPSQLDRKTANQNLGSLSFKNEIKLQDIDFRHEEAEKKVLSGINLTIKKGEMVGFVGKSGSGKSTMVDLLLGLQKPQSGKVMVDGVNVQEDLQGWHRCIGYVPQTVFLCDATLAQNIAFGVPFDRIDQKRVWQVIKEVNLTDLVEERPDNIHMPMGQNGVKLSGGQRQRVGIARALYHKPQVLVLDEVTSALDSKTEKKIVQTLEEMHGRKTILIVSHKEETLAYCDRILSLKNGQIMEVQK